MDHRILAIDTVTPACSVALFEGQQLIDHRYAEIGRGHAEKLVPMIAELPERGRAGHILVNCGPGSFTGVRIGLSAAKALAFAWQAQLSGYNCLQLVALQSLAELDQSEPLMVAMTAGHGEVFAQNFDAKGRPLGRVGSLLPETALQQFDTRLIAGSAAGALAALDDCREALPLLPDAAKTLLLPAEDLLSEVRPVYGRAPDAVPARKN